MFRSIRKHVDYLSPKHTLPTHVPKCTDSRTTCSHTHTHHRTIKCAFSKINRPTSQHTHTVQRAAKIASLPPMRRVSKCAFSKIGRPPPPPPVRRAAKYAVQELVGLFYSQSYTLTA
eukprot:103174_1